MHRQTFPFFRSIAFAACLIATSAIAKDKVDAAVPIELFDGGTLTPTHVIAWEEWERDERSLVVYLLPQAIPEAAWLDAERRDSAIGQAMEKAQAPYSVWLIAPGNQLTSIMHCNAQRACMGEGVNVINGIATARSTLEVDGNRLRGKLEAGSGVCDEDWCEVTISIGIDAALVPAPLLARVDKEGSASDAQAHEASAALATYWKAAGKAKRSADIEPFLTAERTAEGRRQSEDMGEWGEKAFVDYFVPAHAGKLEVKEVRVLGDAAVAHIKTRGTGEDARDMACRVLLRKQDGAWKIGPEAC